MKHVELKLFKTAEYVDQNIVRIIQIRTDEQLADLLTKPLADVDFINFRKMLLTTQEDLK